MEFPSTEKIEHMKQAYVGKRIELISMPEDPDPIKPGEQGVCWDVDAAGSLMVNWDSGRSLSLVPGTDQFKIVS